MAMPLEITDCFEILSCWRPPGRSGASDGWPLPSTRTAGSRGLKIRSHRGRLLHLKTATRADDGRPEEGESGGAAPGKARELSFRWAGRKKESSPEEKETVKEEGREGSGASSERALVEAELAVASSRKTWARKSSVRAGPAPSGPPQVRLMALRSHGKAPEGGIPGPARNGPPAAVGRRIPGGAAAYRPDSERRGSARL